MNQTCAAIWLGFLGTLLGGPLGAQSTSRVSVSSAGVEGDDGSGGSSISGDGRRIAFASLATNLVSPPTDGAHLQVYVHDRPTGSTTLVSVSSSGQRADQDCRSPALSSDGRYVAFESYATNLVANDTLGWRDIFVHDLQTATTTRVSVGPGGSESAATSQQSSISADGRFVAFLGRGSDLVPGDTNGAWDIFVHDRQTGVTERVNVDSSGAEANGYCYQGPAISEDGRFVAFGSMGSNLVPGDTNGSMDTFVHDRLTGATERVSLDSAGAQVIGHSGFDDPPSISGDGRFVAFGSSSGQLTPETVSGYRDVFVHDRQTGTTLKVSRNTAGQDGNQESFLGWVSADGRCVAFYSYASNLVPNDTNNGDDVFVHDLATRVTTRISVSSSGAQAIGTSVIGRTSADGLVVTFSSDAENLVPGDTNFWGDVFVHERLYTLTPICFGEGLPPCPCAGPGSTDRGCQNSAATGGALLAGSGLASLGSDTLSLAVTGELPTSLTIFLQGSSVVAPVAFGDGKRCAGGALKRLRVEGAVGGAASYPSAGETPVHLRSASLGDPISPGEMRAYQVYYRDPSDGFCPPPAGSTFNSSNALVALWGP